jgi:ABC-type phosphate transport system substrate-binding protein
MGIIRHEDHLQLLGGTMKKWIIMIGLLCFSSAVPAWAGSMIVIAHNATPYSTLTMDEVQRIFLGKKTVWANGDRIVPVCLKKGKNHDSFLRAYLDMNSSQFEIFWKQAIFTGKGQMPKTFASETDIVHFVRDTPGSLGYIDSSTQHTVVKTIEMK